MQAKSNIRGSRWIYLLVLVLMAPSIVFGWAPPPAYGQSETPPPPPQVAPPDLGGELSAQCTPPDEPPAPEVVSPASGSTVSTITPLLVWEGHPRYCPDYYNIQIWVDGGAMVLSAWPTLAKFTVPARKLNWGVKYNWYVWQHGAIKGFGEPLIASFTTTTVTNDEISFATVINATPYTITEDTTAATTASTDPTLPAGCGTGQGSKSVWWKFTPNSKGTLDVNTAGSNYDTILAIWTGTATPGGALVNVACNDNVSGNDFTSAINGLAITHLDVQAHKVYYIEVVQSGAEGTGGTLQLSVVFNSAAVSATFVSVGAYDGWILERSDGSGRGLTFNSTDSILTAGDTANGRRFYSILSFNSAPLPDNAVIIGATITLTMSSIAEPTPFGLFDALVVDIRKPFFGTSIKVQPTDFQAAPNLKRAGVIKEPPTPTSPYIASLLPAAFPYIAKAGTTQFKLRFAGDDADNDRWNTIKFYSGDAPDEAFRPVLAVTYYTP